MNFYGMPMKGRYEQVEVYSKQEFMRRQALIHGVMEKNDLQLVILLDCTQEAHDQWLTGVRFLDSCIVTADECIGVLREGYYSVAGEAGCLFQSMPEKVADNISFVDKVSERGIVEIAAKYAPKRVGLVNGKSMTDAMGTAFAELLPGAELVDVTLAVDVEKAVKSDEEIAAIRNAGIIQEKLLRAVPQLLRPGRTMHEVNNEVSYIVNSLGATGFLHSHLMDNGPQDQPSRFDPEGNRTIEYGDRFFSLFESNGFGGHHIAMGRQYVLGEPEAEFAEAMEQGIKLNKFAGSQMKPGVSLAEIVKSTEEYAASIGAALKKACWMHGLGGFYYEQYSVNDISYYEPLRENTVLHCHPILYRYFPKLGEGVREDFFWLDTYVVTPEGGRSLVDLPLELQVID